MSNEIHFTVCKIYIGKNLKMLMFLEKCAKRINRADSLVVVVDDKLDLPRLLVNTSVSLFKRLGLAVDEWGENELQGFSRSGCDDVTFQGIVDRLQVNEKDFFSLVAIGDGIEQDVEGLDAN